MNEWISHLSSDLCTGLISTNTLNIYSCHLPTKFLQPANLTTNTILSLFILQVEPAPHLLSPYLKHPYLPHYKSPTALSHMHHQLPSSFRQPHCVHSPPGSPHPTYITSHSHHLRSHHLSLPRPFTPDLKLISFTNPFLHSHSYSFRTDFTDLNLYCIKVALALFVLVSFSGYVS